jgi:subtilisin family serine protease
MTGSDTRVDADIAIVDTGVAVHDDLNVVGGYDCTGSKSWLDENGHGTHVAGTAAALDNAIGVVGVAPGARIWSVKVLNSDGVGKASWLLCGINWIAAQRDGNRPLIEVANFSLRFRRATVPADDGNCGYTLVDPIHQAVCRAVSRGIIVVAAAGNDSRNASRYRPGAYREVVTVSALSDLDGVPGSLAVKLDGCSGSKRAGDDRLAPFSNYGRAIKIMAPGKCVWSTHLRNRYRSMSGTSMATPHVSGAAALYRLSFPKATPKQIRKAMVKCGDLGWVTKSDRDNFHEPVVNVAALCSP